MRGSVARKQEGFRKSNLKREVVCHENGLSAEVPLYSSLHGDILVAFSLQAMTLGECSTNHSLPELSGDQLVHSNSTL